MRENQSAPCRRVFSLDPDELPPTEEELKRYYEALSNHKVDQLFEEWRERDPAWRDYLESTLFLFERPFPFTLTFLKPWIIKQSGKDRLYPMTELIRATEQMPFEKSVEIYPSSSDGAVWRRIQIPSSNLSFERVTVNKALRMGYDYWLRAAEHEPTICNTESKPKQKDESFPRCFTVIRIVSANSGLEPRNFASGIAICFTDSNLHSFLYGCSLMAFKTKDKKKYIMAVIQSVPAVELAFADDFGAFTIVCTLPSATLGTKPIQIKSVFELEGIYSIDGAIRIEAESSFRYFAEVRRALDELLRPPRFGGAKHASGYDNRSRHCEVGLSGSRHQERSFL